MNIKIRRFIDVVGLGFLVIVAANYCYCLGGFVFGIDVVGFDNIYLFIAVLVMSLWGMYSLWRLPKCMCFRNRN